MGRREAPRIASLWPSFVDLRVLRGTPLTGTGEVDHEEHEGKKHLRGVAAFQGGLWHRWLGFHTYTVDKVFTALPANLVTLHIQSAFEGPGTFLAQNDQNLQRWQSRGGASFETAVGVAIMPLPHVALHRAS